MSRLLVFDIDDTLAHTARHFDAFFYEALEAIVGPEHVERHLGAWTHVTDEGIVREAMQSAHGAWSIANRDAIKDGYFSRMESGFLERPEVAGADALLAHLRDHTDWAIALATGNWHTAAEVKLRSASVDIAGAPLAGCDDRPSRTAVMEHAVDLAADHYGRTFERVVYVGDASWDVKASRALQWPFVGVTDAKGMLGKLGTSHVLPDLTDVDAFLRAADEAVPPR